MLNSWPSFRIPSEKSRWDFETAFRIGLALLLGAWASAAGAAAANGALTLAVKADGAATVTQLLDAHHVSWAGAPAQRLQFNRTPPLYAGDPLDDNARPTTTLQLARIAGGAVVLRAHWTDPTGNTAGAGKRYPDAGADPIYHRATERTDAFTDAFCVMIPVRRGPSPQYPSMMMGEAGQPVDLYYWRAGAGFQVLAGHGRATTGPPSPAGPPPPGRAAREGDGWTLTLALTNLPPGTPVCFAIWDGSKEQRDGLKYFSLWYEVQ